MPHKQKLSVRIAVWILLFLTLVLFSSKIIKKVQPNVSIPNLNMVSSFNFSFESSGLSNIVQKDLAGQSGDYAIYIEDLTDGEKYDSRASEVFPSASLYKLYLIAAVLKEASSSSGLSMDTELTATKSHLTDVFGDTDFGYEDYNDDDEISYSVDEALQRVGRISDNFAAIMLAEKIGWPKVQDMADSLGSKQTTIHNPISTSAADIGNFYKLLYQKQVVNPEISDQITEILKLDQINDRIPAGVPDDVTVIHKTGELSGVRHDAGIVYLSGRPYIIVLMSQNLKYEDDGVDTLAQISKDVFTYFSDKKST